MEKITFEKWNEFVDTDYAEWKDIQIKNNNGEEMTISIRTYIPMEDRISFVASVVDMGNVDGELYPPVLNVSFALYSIIYFTNIDCSTDIENIYAMVSTTNIMDVLYNNIKVLHDIYVESCDCAKLKHDYVNTVARTIKNAIDEFNKLGNGDKELAMKELSTAIDNLGFGENNT